MVTPVVLVVRTQAKRTGVAALRRMGFDPYVVATALIEPVFFDRKVPCAALIITSATTAAFIPQHWRDLPVFAVGVATARAAQRVGCSDVRLGPGDGVGLVQMVRAASLRGPILHLGGVTIAVDVARTLSDVGVLCVHLPCYRLMARPHLSRKVCAALQTGRVSDVLISSEQAAQFFMNSVALAGLEVALATCHVHVISARVAQALNLQASDIYIAPSPDMQGLVKSVQSRLTDTRSA